MAKAKYMIGNGNDLLGVIWEVDNKEIVVVYNNLDIEKGITVKDAKSGKIVKEADMLDMLSEILPLK